MITPPSAEFTTAASSNRRYPKIKIDALWTDPFVQSGNTVTSSHVNNFGDLDSEVVDDLLLHVADTKLSTPHKYVINDGTLINDGTFYPVPGTIEEAAYNQVGWYTSGVADGAGDFATPQQITVTFAEARTVKQLIVVGEPTLGEYPTDFDVEVYDDDDVLLNSVTNYTGTSVETIVDLTADEINTAKYMVLTLNSWSAADTIGKIVEFFGVVSDTFTGTDIVSMNILEELMADDGTPYGAMSSNELTIDLQNISLTKDGTDIEDPFLPENTASYLKNSITQNVRLTPYIGFLLPDTSIEYVKMGVYWSMPDWEVSQSEYSASVTARDRMEILRNNTFIADEILESTSLAEIAEYVLNSAKVNIPLNDLEWDVDSSLEDFSVDYAWLGKVTYFEALTQIAKACIGRCYCNRDGVIVLESYLSDSVTGSADFTLTGNDYFKLNRKMQKIKNYIKVPVCPLIPEDEDDDIYTSDEITVGESDTTIEQEIDLDDIVVYEYSDVIIEDTDVEMYVSVSEYYPNRFKITFTKATGTSGTFNYKIVGKKLVPTEGNEPVIDFDADSISKYDKQEHELKDNYLIQTTEVAELIASVMLLTLKNNRRDATVEYQGNPCYEIGDRSDSETYTKLSRSEEFRTIRQRFVANRSGLRCKMTAKKTINYGE